MTTITIPRETWDAMREALEHGIKWLNICDKPRECIPLHEALSAAKAVSDEPKVKLIPTAEELGTPVQPQAQGEASCGTCGNTYLAVRTDVYKDKREFMYCDCCGAMADRKTWNRAHPQASEPVALKERSTNPLATQNQVELTDKASEPAWRDIETAPKDGTDFMGGWFDMPNFILGCSMRPVKYHQNSWWESSEDYKVRTPTHWMPLPAAPEDTK